MKAFNVKAFYIYKFINRCLPIYAFYTILFIEKGLSVTDIAILIALWSGFTVAFEIPSGVLADRWSRRNMLAMATVLQGICFIVWFFSHTIFLFAIGFVFWAVAEAFSSGTEESLIYDNLKSDGCEESFTKVYGKAQFYASAGTFAGIASAGVIANFISIEIISLLSAAICFTNLVFILQIREKNFYAARISEDPMAFLETFKEAGSFVKNSKIALVSIVFLVLFASLGSYLDEFDPLIINDFKLNKIWVSVILAARFLFVALGYILAPIVEKRISSISRIILLSGLSCFLLAVFALIWNRYAILVFGLACMVAAVVEILLVNALQNEIKEEGRATITSFYGVGQNITMICFGLLYALLAGIFTLQQVYIIISIYGLVGVLGFYLLIKTISAKA